MTSTKEEHKQTHKPSTMTHRPNLNKNLIRISLQMAGLCLVALLVVTSQLALGTDSPQAQQPLSSRAAFLRAQRASRAQQSQAASNQTATGSTTSTSSTTTTSTTTPRPQRLAGTSKLDSASLPSNRSTRTADVFQNGDGFNIFVTNTCEREAMKVNIKTSRPFFGVIHTRNQRQKAVCTVEGTGETEYDLQISHVLNSQDPNYCGVIKARRDSPEDKDLLSVVIAVRVHRNIELSDDKFFLLNCTNRCRRPDCSSPKSDELRDNPETENGERESVTPSSNDEKRKGFFEDLEGDKECNIYKFPWVITLLWCMAILLLAMIISHCIMCSSMVCKCVKTEVEEREPSVYEDGAGGRLSDDEDNLYNKKNHPMRIDYDNRDIYKTSNNYEPYNLNNADDDDDQSEIRTRPKTRHSKSSSRHR